MLVLLIIFLVSAPLITTGIVDLPSVGKARQRAQHVIEVVVATDERLKVRIDQGDASAVGLNQLVSRIKDLQAGNADTPVVIAADRNVKYEQVVKVMDVLQRAGVARVGLAVKQSG
jgi:biopolymer transport protein TolR